jgi:PAS domain S-box-containing protein
MEKALLSVILEHSNDAVVALTPEGVIEQWNPAAEELFGYASAEVEGRPIAFLADQNRSSEQSEWITRGLAGELIRNRETVFLGKDGRRVDVSVTIAPLKNEPGQVLGVVAIARDITRRLRSREALEKRNRELLTFHRLSEIFLAGRSPEDSYREITSELRAATGFPIASIALLDEARGTLVVHETGREQGDQPRTLEYPIDATLSGIVLRTGKPLIQKHLLDHVQYRKLIVSWAPAQTFLGFPLRVGGTIIGSLNLAHTEDLEVGEQTIRWVESLANYVAALTARKRSEEELRTSREQLRELSRWTQSAVEEERKRIAREIHDELGQELSLLQLELGMIREGLPSEEEEIRGRLLSMTGQIDAAIRSVQKISTDLRPTLLDNLGLVAAVEWAVKEFEKRSGIPCRLSVTPPDFQLDQERSTALFRILQEALTNVLRHAHASRVDVRLSKERAAVELQIRDDGLGIPVERITDTKSVGLTGIRERVHPWGGTVAITGSPEKGTEVAIKVPLEP